MQMPETWQRAVDHALAGAAEHRVRMRVRSYRNAAGVRVWFHEPTTHPVPTRCGCGALVGHKRPGDILDHEEWLSGHAEWLDGRAPDFRRWRMP